MGLRTKLSKPEGSVDFSLPQETVDNMGKIHYSLAMIGWLSLKKNGVPATDNGFLQVLMTTRGRPVLDQIAAGGYLGGDDNIPPQLEQLEVRFGELINPDDPLRTKEVSLAGFGCKDEVVPLERGKKYATMD